MPFFLIFVIIPLIEIALFIMIGAKIGILATLSLCFASAIFGFFLVHLQGLRAIAATQDAIRRARMPLAEVFDGICLALGGILLIVPGFFTDFLGVCLFISPVRARLREALKRFWLPAEYDDFFASGNSDPSDDYGVYKVIEGEFERVDGRGQEEP